MSKVCTTIKEEWRDGIATVSLNRPEMRNAFEPQMIADLTQTFAELSARTDCQAIVLRGEGTSFCSGADLAWMKSMVQYSFVENQADSNRLFSMFAAIRNCPHPVIAKVHGHVMGGALGLVAACDIAAAEKDTSFCFSEVRLGLAPAVISPFVLEKMNVAHARRWMLTGSVFKASDALVSGLIHHAGSATEVDTFVAGLLKNFCENGPEAVRATKQLINFVVKTTDWNTLCDKTTRVIAERRASVEGQEGLRGFLEKREPSWKVRPN